MDIKFSHKGKWTITQRWLEDVLEKHGLGEFDKYGREGVKLLKAATPRDTGETANSWDYTITKSKGRYTIAWTNSKMADGQVPVAILLQYGHVSKDGYYIQGIDFINPALRPLFEEIAQKAWEEVTG